MCSTWEGGSGSNACFVTEPEDLIAGFSSPPDEEIPLEREARIIEWIERNDGIDPSLASYFYSWIRFPDWPATKLRK